MPKQIDMTIFARRYMAMLASARVNDSVAPEPNPEPPPGGIFGEGVWGPDVWSPEVFTDEGGG